MVGRFETALELLLSFMESPASGDKYLRLRRASEAIARSLQEPSTLPVAARRFGFSVTTFSREFGRHAGMPFSDFLLSRRLEKAKTLLQGDLSLAQVPRPADSAPSTISTKCSSARWGSLRADSVFGKRVRTI